MIRFLGNCGLAIAILALSSSSSNADIVFDADFEAGTVAASAGTLNIGFTAGPNDTVGLVPTSATGTSFGANSLLIDDDTSDSIFTQLTLDFIEPVLLTNGNTATFSFDVLSRRTTGLQRTQFVTGLDSNGDEVFRFVLSDGTNSTGGRQQPRFATAAGGIQTFTPDTGTAPGQFFYGGDSTPASVNVNQFAQFELTIAENGFDVEGIAQNGSTFVDNDVALFNSGPAIDLASIVISADRTAPANNLTSGNYYDNFFVEGVTAVPEPSSLLALMALAPMVMLRRRR